ncbi:Arginine pathway regulatory protein ArgR, repressor of arg regulon [Corallococcus caeni]|uniref:Arginine repressor n=2 Tax=Corallococcus TaxID=83461 RepID=A0A7Y4NEW7_9BACT|nr:arginine repressor [Corallococcus exercitus]NOK10315.1 arginine repressor [Corallococcus exercitus]GMU00021.1 Arginine pathway regulatory protein ArgR, repressor of arg regulon [Corallococcus sp. KH5-1]GMU09164.1 Arginine pathway regulatory protein ArgR, repressor of arg regulon [Corallococcus sp. NO1]
MNLDDAILQLISRQDVPDQAVLQTLLEEAGHAPSQSTLSRRLKKLSVQKVNGRYQRTEPPVVPVPLAPRVTIIEAPPNMLVLKTAPGYAQIFGLALDREEVEGLAGTVAGDDTIFIAVRDPSLLQDVREAVEQLIQRGP